MVKLLSFSGPKLHLFLFIFAFGLYANTIPNKYALDDSIVITENRYTQKGFSGIWDILSNGAFDGFFDEKKALVEGGRYRPLAQISFAIEHELWGSNPHISHLINALLYALIAIVLFQVINAVSLFFLNQEKAYLLALASSLLFIAHPIHTEVVANIKSRDELLALLLGLLAIKQLLSLDALKFKKYIWAGLLFLLALLAKESAIGIFILLMLMVSFCKEKRDFRLPLPFVVAGGIYFLIRQSVLNIGPAVESMELMNNPYLGASPVEETATSFYVLWRYFKLMLVPYPLTYDYYPNHIELQDLNSPLVLLSIALHLLLLGYALRMIRKHPLFSIGILYYLINIAIYANFFFNIGTFMNERFLFFASIGFILTISYMFVLAYFRIKGKQRPVLVGAFITLLVAGSVWSIKRNTVWKDNETLFLNDIKVSANSIKGNCTAGGILLEKAEKIQDESSKRKMLKEAIPYLQKAINLYPEYADALLLMGNAQYMLNKDPGSAIPYYSKILNRNPSHGTVLKNLHFMAQDAKMPVQRIEAQFTILKYQPHDVNAMKNLAQIYGRELGQLDSAIYYLKQAEVLEPNNLLVHRDLGVAHAMQNAPREANIHFRKALELDSLDKSNWINLGLNLQQLGQEEEARKLFSKAESMH